MKFKIDENLPIEMADLLTELGHDAATVYAEQLAGSRDAVLIKECQIESRALITLDLDFADIRTYPPSEYAGLVVLRLRRQDKPHVLNILSHAAL